MKLERSCQNVQVLIELGKKQNMLLNEEIAYIDQQ